MSKHIIDVSFTGASGDIDWSDCNLFVTTDKQRKWLGCLGSEREGLSYDNLEYFANLFAAAPEMLALLRELAQIKEPMAYPTYCPFCDKEFDSDHEPDCRLGKLLREVDSEC